MEKVNLFFFRYCLFFNLPKYWGGCLESFRLQPSLFLLFGQKKYIKLLWQPVVDRILTKRRNWSSPWIKLGKLLFFNLEINPDPIVKLSRTNKKVRKYWPWLCSICQYFKVVRCKYNYFFKIVITMQTTIDSCMYWRKNFFCVVNA